VQSLLHRTIKTYGAISIAPYGAYLHVSTRTLENWEQGRSRPNEQAATLILLVRHFPDTLTRLQRLAA
jgi:putative transcriptional regulator